MSQETKTLQTVEGKIEAVNNRKGQEFYGLLVNDEWQNGRNPMPEELEKGVSVRIKSDPEADFYNVKDITILEEGNEDGRSRGGSDSQALGEVSDSGVNPSNMSPRQASIMANSAVKMAVENAETSYGEDKKGHIEEVNQKSQAYQNIMKQRLGENQ